jgi:hypothetical protein
LFLCSTAFTVILLACLRVKYDSPIKQKAFKIVHGQPIWIEKQINANRKYTKNNRRLAIIASCVGAITIGSTLGVTIAYKDSASLSGIITILGALSLAISVAAAGWITALQVGEIETVYTEGTLNQMTDDDYDDNGDITIRISGSDVIANTDKGLQAKVKLYYNKMREHSGSRGLLAEVQQYYKKKRDPEELLKKRERERKRGPQIP